MRRAHARTPLKPRHVHTHPRTQGERRWREALARGTACAGTRAAWRHQQTRTTCGPCSVSIAASASGARVDEAAVLRAGVLAGVIDETTVLTSGVTLAQVTALAEAVTGLRPRDGAPRHVGPGLGVGCVRTELLNALRADTPVLLNYHMTTLGQGDGGLRGHVSPLGGLHEPTDSALVLDCWPDTEPVWAPIVALTDAMRGLDGASGLSRGYAVLAGPARV